MFKVVLDVGCGTGILSMFAAKAGAKRVYAVDACPKICRIAEQLIRCNRLATQIQIINSRIEDIDKFDEPIDIILSDWMGKIFQLNESNGRKADFYDLNYSQDIISFMKVFSNP